MLYSKIEGEGKPLLILHGFLGMSDNWKTLGSQYATAGFQVHLLDLRNHGRSFHSENFTYADMVDDILQYCDKHQLAKADIMGHSMGGKLAMFFATTFPERVNKLIVADIGPKYYAPHHGEIIAGLNAVDFSVKPDRSTVDDIVKEYVSDSGTRQFLMKSLFWKTHDQLAFRFNLKAFTTGQESIGEALPDGRLFQGETLFIKGENSRYIVEEDFPLLRKHFPKSEISIIKNAGHWLHAENPNDYYNTTIAFLNKA